MELRLATVRCQLDYSRQKLMEAKPKVEIVEMEGRDLRESSEVKRCMY